MATSRLLAQAREELAFVTHQRNEMAQRAGINPAALPGPNAAALGAASLQYAQVSPADRGCGMGAGLWHNKRLCSIHIMLVMLFCASHVMQSLLMNRPHPGTFCSPWRRSSRACSVA